MTILSATNFPGMIYVWVFIRDKLTLMSMIEVHSWVLPNSYTSHDFGDTNKCILLGNGSYKDCK